MAREKRALLLDLAPAFTGKSALFQDHVHLTDEGSLEVAQAVADFFSDVLRHRVNNNG